MKKNNQPFTIKAYLKRSPHPLRQTGDHRLKMKKEFMPGQPLVSIVTVVRNQKETLMNTMTSVLGQTYPNIEYIIVDGASTDGTLEVIKQFDDKIDFWLSEPDFGPSDAGNKAISLARGEYVFWLSADDWIDPDFVETAIKALLKSGADFVFGKMVMYTDGKPVSSIDADKNYEKTLKTGFPRFNFPCMLTKMECFQNVGLFDITCRYTSDYEWFLRLHSYGVRGECENALTVHRKAGGYGDVNPVWSKLELLRILRRFGFPTSKAAVIYFCQLSRMAVGHLAKLLLPDAVHKKIKSFVYGKMG